MSAIEETIDERDRAEQALSQAYYLVTGNSPEWSNQFGHDQALLEIAECVRLLKHAAKSKRTREDEEESAAERTHQVWLDCLCGLCKHFGIDTMKMSFDASETEEETIGHIVGQVRDKLDERIRPTRSNTCEHGVVEGDWCELCNAEYKRAAREHYGEQ